MTAETSKERDTDSLQGVRTLETDIVNFTNNLPYWAQFLSRKMLSGVKVEDSDFKDAYRFLLEDAGLIENEGTRPEISVICKSNKGIYKDDLQLLKVSGIEGINALVPDQLLEFCPNLTIIYGSNGSGKSGYIRLLNNVFITKGEKSILPNIHESNIKAKSAEFLFTSDGKESNLKFPADCSSSEFKQFSVFDEKAVHAHLKKKKSV